MESLELFVESLKSSFFSTLHELSDQVGGCVEANISSLGTGRKRQGTDQVCFTRSRIPHEQHVFSLIEIFSPQKLPNQRYSTVDLSLSVMAHLPGIAGSDRQKGRVCLP